MRAAVQGMPCDARAWINAAEQSRLPARQLRMVRLLRLRVCISASGCGCLPSVSVITRAMGAAGDRVDEAWVRRSLARLLERGWLCAGFDGHGVIFRPAIPKPPQRVVQR